MAINLQTLLPMGRASRYAFPKDATAILARSYGDFTSAGGALPADHDDGGFLPAVMINRLTWTFCLNDGPVPSSPRPIIYANDTPQPDNPGLYTWSPAVNYEGTGHLISTLTCHVDPGSRAISWRGYGTANPSTGALITNPIDALADAFGFLGGWTTNDIDPASVAQTKADMATLGDTVHWSFTEEKNYEAWLQLILQHYYTDFWPQQDGKLRITLDRSVTALPVYVLDTIDAETELVGSTSQPVIYEGNAENLINTARVSRRLKWTTKAYTDEPIIANQASVNVYGTRYRAFELPACYSDAEGLRWWQGLMTRFALKPFELRFTVRGLSLLTALPGTFLGFLWPKQGWSPTARLIKVLEMTPDFDQQTISFRCFDCQRSVVDQVTLPVVPVVENRRRIAEGTIAVDLTPPQAASGLVATGNYRSIVLRGTAPGDMDYSHVEIWASATNDRATAVPVRSGGYVAPGQPFEETFEVPDGASYYVWLMTVDDNGNGKDGGSGPTGGNWYPVSATAGVFATAALVPTVGIQTTAVTFTHGTNVRVPPGSLGNGESAIADAFLDGLYSQGDVIAFGTTQLTFGSLHTVILQIRRGGVLGPVIGVNYIPNILNTSVTPTLNCWGLDFNPAWNGFYVLTAQAVNQAGAQQNFTIFGCDLFLRQTKL